MEIVCEVAAAMQRVLGPEVEELGRTSRQIQRQRKFSAVCLLRMLVLTLLKKPRSMIETRGLRIILDPYRSPDSGGYEPIGERADIVVMRMAICPRAEDSEDIGRRRPDDDLGPMCLGSLASRVEVRGYPGSFSRNYKGLQHIIGNRCDRLPLEFLRTSAHGHIKRRA